MAFRDSLETGKVGESLIAKWLLRRGNSVLPVYEIAENQFKGPSLYSAQGRFIAPDMAVLRGGGFIWVEAKHKSAFTWHRQTQRFVTGIDRSHYHAYIEVGKITSAQVWLFFLHRDGTAKDTPAGLISPTGLFCGEIQYLAKHINHEHDGWGRSGMVYWAAQSLRLIAPLDEVC